MNEEHKDTQTPAETGQTAPEMTVPEEQSHGEHTWLGPAVGVLIVLLVLLLGGLYLWSSSQTRDMQEQTAAETEEIEELDNELEALDQEFADLEDDFAEIDAALESEIEIE